MRAIVALMAAFVVVGCGSDPTPSSLPSVTDASSATANPWLAADVVARSVQFRQSYGLRSDLPWVYEVAGLPEAAEGFRTYSVPLTSEELKTLQQRASDLERVQLVVEVYGREHADQWGGSSRDNRRGAVLARFTGGVEDHEAALRAKLAPEAKLIVVQVRWSLADLEAVKQRIFLDVSGGSDWLKDQNAVSTGLAIDELANQVKFRVSSTRTDLDPILESHYDAIGMLWVITDGTGVETLPKGSIEGRVVDAAGKPVPGLRIELDAGIEGACGTELGFGTDLDGRFVISNCAAVTYTIFAYTPFSDQLPSELLGASGPVTVQGGKTTAVQITIP